MTRVIGLPTFDLSRVMLAVKNDDTAKKPIPREMEEQALKEKLKKMETAYREFLLECKTSPDAVTPTADADIVWHKHILHSQQYVRDCHDYFGYYLHHEPTDVDCTAPSGPTPGSCKGTNCLNRVISDERYTPNFFQV